MNYLSRYSITNAYLFDRKGCFNCTFCFDKNEKFFCVYKKKKEVNKNEKCENWRKNKLLR